MNTIEFGITKTGKEAYQHAFFWQIWDTKVELAQLAKPFGKVK